MYRYILIVTAIMLSFQLKAQQQVGINTTNPLDIVHIDSKGDTQGTQTSATNTSDDVVISEDGYLGIGTVNPTNRLSVAAESGMGTGLQLTNGAVKDYVLSSDSEGNAIWIAPPLQFQTFVSSSTVAAQSVTGPKVAQVIPIVSFDNVLTDTAKDFFGADYGWNTATQEYKVPVTALYRLTSQVYFLPNIVKDNYRTGWMLNGNTAPQQAMGFYSFVDTGSPVTAYSSNIYQLNKDDILQFGVIHQFANNNVQTSTVKFEQGVGYTFIIIELLEFDKTDSITSTTP